ncbi:MAG: oligosaccharide flippase family protein, partial [Chloroflexi bacterium]|nr:oligosaccharide flippase family protein [Chloroflexota bacterium]
MQFNTHSSLPVNLVHRLWDRRNIPFYSNSVFLISHSGATAGIAFLFWVVATRSFSPEEVGISSALISAAALLSFFARFGMGDGIIRFLASREGEPSRLINSVFLATGAAAILVSVVFLVGLPVWSQPLRLVLGQPLIMAVFIISVIGLAGAGLME